MLTLNQIVSQITNLAAAHNQIAESGVGDFAEWQAKERTYPILWVFHESTSVNQMEIAFSIRLICADRVIVGEEGDNTEGHEQEVISDTLLVLLDFLAYFQQNHSQPYNVVTSATIDPFTERLNDRLAGNSVTIQIRQPFDWNKCQIPQSGASIPPTVDGLTLYNFCDAAVLARLTDAQNACLSAAFNEPCEDVDITINSTPFGTSPSGGTFNVPVVNGGDNPVGAEQSGEWVIGNSTVTINGTQVGDIEAEDSLPIAVELDGNPSGTWNAGTQTWEVTTPPCADATFSIDGVQVDTVASGADLDVTLLLDGVAPPSYTYNAGTDTLNVISPPPSTGWVRPSDWIAIPELTSADERFCGVVVVFENGYNALGVNITSLAANIDWGDGSSVVSNGSVQTKVYDYATLGGAVNVWPDGRNYKQVLVNITRVGGAITSMVWNTMLTVNRRGVNNFVDIILSLPSVTNLSLSTNPASNFRPMSLLQRLRVRNTGVVSGYALASLQNLRALEWDVLTGSVSSQLTQIGFCDVGNINATGTFINQLFEGSRIRSIGNFTANNATGGLSQSVFRDCRQLVQVGNVTMLTATNITSLFGVGGGLGCQSLTKVGTINAPLAEVLTTLFSGASLLSDAIFTNCAAVTTTSDMFINCVSLVSATMPNLTRGVNFSTTALTTAGAVTFGNSIGIAAGVQTVTVTSTPFGQALAALDPAAVAAAATITGKGYTIAN